MPITPITAPVEPMLQMMESIAATIPEAVRHARKEAYDRALDDLVAAGALSHAQRGHFWQANPWADTWPEEVERSA